ncbi:MFS transporter [Ferviditalea candida]|uniref:MFS transporter n=1 Tax=Ferviditalea candida TaxID=3108399 RepID=A0ABU5ZHW2_9BACL|nr:MFS transporter [Paenibacillaceae bacterium T2]
MSHPEALSTNAKRSIWAAFLGFFVDMFDVYLPIVALGPAIQYFQPKSMPSTVSTTIYFVVFAISLIGRPLGATIFGHYADKIGRKRTTQISVTGFAIVTLLIALLPGYQQIGIWGLVLLTFLRLLDGIFLGGEYTSASPLAMEYCPQSKRGFYGALIMGGFPAAYVAISLVTAFVLNIVPIAGGLNSPYVQWGWRIPFIIGALIAFVFVWYFSRTVQESELWLESKKASSPLKELFTGDNAKNFWQVFILMSGFWFTLNSTVSTLPGLLINYLKIPSSVVTNGFLVINVFLFLGYLSAGVISQKMGRRPFLISMGILTTVVGSLLYWYLLSTVTNNAGKALFLAGILEILCISVWGLATTYINERFHTSVRASGFGLGYSLAVIIPSFYSFFMLWLSNLMPYQYTAVVLVVLGGLLTTIGAALGPETKNVIFRAEK